MPAGGGTRWKKLGTVLRRLGPSAVAFSGGVDSALLVAAAQAAWGVRLLAVVADSPLLDPAEKRRALAFLREKRVPYVRLPLRGWRTALGNHGPRRCYTCKANMLRQVRDLARRRGFSQVCDGSQADDLRSGRPGLAALREQGVFSPLALAGLNKAEVRELAGRILGPAWAGKPSESCLATRLVNIPVTPGSLERARRLEHLLKRMGFSGHRVRLYRERLRLELASGQWGRLAEPGIRARLLKQAGRMGWHEVAVDLKPRNAV